MSTNAPTAQNRTGARPTYILLAVDGHGADWLWRVTDDAVFVIDGAERERLALNGHSPEALVARIAAERGLAEKYLAGSLAEALGDALR